MDGGSLNTSASAQFDIDSTKQSTNNQSSTSSYSTCGHWGQINFPVSRHVGVRCLGTRWYLQPGTVSNVGLTPRYRVLLLPEGENDGVWLIESLIHLHTYILTYVRTYVHTYIHIQCTTRQGMYYIQYVQVIPAVQCSARTCSCDIPETRLLVRG
jgi:hypothetical protein